MQIEKQINTLFIPDNDNLIVNQLWNYKNSKWAFLLPKSPSRRPFVRVWRKWPSNSRNLSKQQFRHMWENFAKWKMGKPKSISKKAKKLAQKKGKTDFTVFSRIWRFKTVYFRIITERNENWHQQIFRWRSSRQSRWIHRTIQSTLNSNQFFWRGFK